MSRAKKLFLALGIAAALITVTVYAATSYSERRLDASRRSFEGEVGSLAPESYRTAPAGAPALDRLLTAAGVLPNDAESRQIIERWEEAAGERVSRAGGEGDSASAGEAVGGAGRVQLAERTALAQRAGAPLARLRSVLAEEPAGLGLLPADSLADREGPSFLELLHAARMLHFDAHLALDRLAAGEAADGSDGELSQQRAIEDGAALARLGDLLSGEPTLLTQLLGAEVHRRHLRLVHRALTDPEAPMPLALALADQAADFDDRAAFRRALGAEAAHLWTVMAEANQGAAQAGAAGDAGDSAGTTDGIAGLPRRFADRQIGKLHRAWGLDSYRGVIRLTAAPYDQLAGAARRSDASGGDEELGALHDHPVAALLVPNLLHGLYQVRLNAAARHAATAAAAAAVRGAGSAGSYPERLPKLESEGEGAAELAYRRLPDGGAEISVPAALELLEARPQNRPPAPLRWRLPAL